MQVMEVHGKCRESRLQHTSVAEKRQLGYEHDPLTTRTSTLRQTTGLYPKDNLLRNKSLRLPGEVGC